jgi:hypothetical protein
VGYGKSKTDAVFQCDRIRRNAIPRQRLLGYANEFFAKIAPMKVSRAQPVKCDEHLGGITTPRVKDIFSDKVIRLETKIRF